ncbi:DNA sulfur modification protein DndD [Cohnella sp. GCM10012308]|uniref:DNA sulfur modification protein DndD n=1 Tax=Cohnella sp. GCM10012308 TaxID=3317329 RepID=UPI003614F06E
MIFNYIRFNNYRPYYGSQEVSFKNEKQLDSPYKANITLIGGKNGHGKTSLINAVFICLYGRRKFLKDEYEQIKRDAINRTFYREGGRESTIELSFSDRTGQYLIEVTFKETDKGEVQENRRIFVIAGDLLREATTSDDEFIAFIDQRIPLDVAPFFIFDAEKIKDLVGEHDKEKTVKAIQKIVSLELYNQLHLDLNQIRYNTELNLSKSVKDTDLEKLVKELETCTDELESLKAKERPDDLKIQYLSEEKNRLNQERRRKLANASSTKGQIHQRIGELENELKKLNQAVKSFDNALPKLIIKPLVIRLQQAIRKEQNYQTALSRSQAMFAPYDKFITDMLSKPMTPALSVEQKNQLMNHGRETWTRINKVQEMKVEPMNVLHVDYLSNNELQNILNWSPQGNINISEILTKRTRVENELKTLHDQIKDAPDVIDTHEEDEQISKVSEELGALYSTRKARNEVLRRLQDQHVRLSRELTNKRQARQELGPVEEKVNMMTKLINATQEFIDQVTVLKAKRLKVEIETILLQLFRKNDLHRVEFHPEEFVLRIYDDANSEINLVSRSEGEKQLIALAMIWALTKVSGTSFPFVIDTPLARLDSDHKSNLVNRFFTNLSDQVIILSTDTEITKDFYEEITPYVQKSYLLEYNEEVKSTEIMEGYFAFE